MRYVGPLGLAVALGTLASGPLVAQRPGPGMAPGGFALYRMMNADFDGFASRLALTDGQRTELQDLLAGFAGSNEDPLRRMTAMMQELRERRLQGRPEPGAMQAIAEKHGHPQQELQPALQGFEQAVEEALTDDQRATLARLLQARMGRRR